MNNVFWNIIQVNRVNGLSMTGCDEGDEATDDTSVKTNIYLVLMKQ